MTNHTPDRLRCQAYPQNLGLNTLLIGDLEHLSRCVNAPSHVITVTGENFPREQYSKSLCRDCLSLYSQIRPRPSEQTAKIEKLESWLAKDDRPLQNKVGEWMIACFGHEIAGDKLERCHRFLEEALELVQSLDMPRDHAVALIDYTYNRERGETGQEVGGVMLTLAALCNATGYDLDTESIRELNRVWTKVDEIRAKQAAKPKGSALPQEIKQATDPGPVKYELAAEITEILNEINNSMRASRSLQDNDWRTGYRNALLGIECMIRNRNRQNLKSFNDLLDEVYAKGKADALGEPES